MESIDRLEKKYENSIKKLAKDNHVSPETMLENWRKKITLFADTIHQYEYVVPSDEIILPFSNAVAALSVHASVILLHPARKKGEYDIWYQSLEIREDSSQYLPRHFSVPLLKPLIVHQPLILPDYFTTSPLIALFIRESRHKDFDRECKEIFEELQNEYGRVDTSTIFRNL